MYTRGHRCRPCSTSPSQMTRIPGVLIHGRFDIGSPPDVPWLLHNAWPGSELQLVRTGHHGGDEMTGHQMAAQNRFARH
jgi:proline iminopeptidase